jgi:hypothetical protein
MDYNSVFTWTLVAATFVVWAWMAIRGEKIAGGEDASHATSSSAKPPIQCYECLSPLEYGRTPEECASACGMPA